MKSLLALVCAASTAWSVGLIYSVHPLSHTSLSGYQAYCQSDYFRVKCDQDEVILITHARYGRMRLSRCVKEVFGYIGCSVEVLDIMDSHCSGRRSCSVRVLDDNFENYKPCHDDLKSYLEVAYICVKVIVPERHLCQNLKPVTIRNQSGYLASAVSAETGCGAADSPWLIELLPGQRINITLFDFAVLGGGGGGGGGSNSSAAAATSAASSSSSFVPGGGGGDEQGDWTGETASNGGGGGRGGGGHAAGETVPKMCRVYAVIREASVARGITVCGGEARSRPAYVSLENAVEIRLITTGKGAATAAAAAAAQNTVNFMLRYEAFGCPDVQAPHGGWIKRQDNTVVLGCTDNRDKWQLRCQGVTWVGDRKNCSKAERIVIGEISNNLSLPLGVSFVIIVTLALAVGFVILAVGIFCLKRIRSDARSEFAMHSSMATTTCFTLNGGRSRGSIGGSAETKTMMAPAVTTATTTVDEFGTTGSRCSASVVHRTRGTASRTQRPNTYACAKLLDQGSPDPDAVDGPPCLLRPEAGPGYPGPGDLVDLYNDHVVYSCDEASSYPSRSGCGGSFGTSDAPPRPRPANPHELNPGFRCCHGRLEKAVFNDDLGNQMTLIGRESRVPASPSGNEAVGLVGSKRRVVFDRGSAAAAAAAKTSATGNCQECENSRLRPTKEPPML